MGQLLSTLSAKNGDAVVPDISFNIESVTPSEEERVLYNQISSMLVQPAPALLKSLQDYQPASEYIRSAISNPTPENEKAAWDALQPIVDMLREFYAYSSELSDCLPQLLGILCTGDVSKNLERYQGLTKLFADILEFVFEFDFQKMYHSTLQNDFSYYRRLLQRGLHNNQRDDTSDLRSAMIEDDEASRISLFIAYPTPMLRCLISCTTEYVEKQRVGKSVCECLAAVWATCFVAVTKKKIQREETIAFCLKVMVITIILYDHIDPQGVFRKQSPINIKNSVKAINTINAPKDSSTSNLMPSLRYNSKHLNDESTPKAVRNLIMT